MLDIAETKKRLIKAIDSYLDYAGSIQYLGDFRYAISKQGHTYVVDLKTQTCNCQDNMIRRQIAPCKHLAIVWIYAYFVERERELEELD